MRIDFLGFGGGFVIFQIMFTLVFVLAFGLFIAIAVKGICQWNKNNHSPRLTVPATVVSKRTNISHHHNHHGAGMHHTTHGNYRFCAVCFCNGENEG